MVCVSCVSVCSMAYPQFFYGNLYSSIQNPGLEPFIEKKPSRKYYRHQSVLTTTPQQTCKEFILFTFINIVFTYSLSRVKHSTPGAKAITVAVLQSSFNRACSPKQSPRCRMRRSCSSEVPNTKLSANCLMFSRKFNKLSVSIMWLCLTPPVADRGLW